MTQFWRRQTAAVPGNWPAQPAPSTGIPYFPQQLAPGMVVGRMPGNTGPTEAIPFSVLAAQIIIASLTPRIVDTNSLSILIDDQLVILKKAVAHSTAIALPPVATRTIRTLEIYDWNGNAGPMTLTPDGSETIMGLASWQVLSGGVAGSGGSLKLISSSELSGWIVR